MYILTFYVSTAASSVGKFNGTSDPDPISWQLNTQPILENICFGALSFNEDLIGEKNLEDVDECTCTKIVRCGTLMDPIRVPELYYTESLKLQLERLLTPKGFTVLSQTCGCRSLLPYNPYWKSLLDLAIFKSDDPSTQLVLCTVAPPPDEEEEEDPTPVTLCTEFKKKNT